MTTDKNIINNIKTIEYFIRKEERDLTCESLKVALQSIPYKYADKFIRKFNSVYEEKRNGHFN
jgi:predicted adenine nucleotide alpha hydrolase (AANH) superfamily ATPase